MVKVGLGRREGGPVMCGEDGGREVRSCMEREVLSFQTCHNICGSLSLDLQKCCKVRGSLFNLPSSCQHTYIHAYLPTGDLLMTTD